MAQWEYLILRGFPENWHITPQTSENLADYSILMKLANKPVDLSYGTDFATEYRKLEDNFWELLSALGKAGWELVNTETVTGGAYVETTFYFKRPVV